MKRSTKARIRTRRRLARQQPTPAPARAPSRRLHRALKFAVALLAVYLAAPTPPPPEPEIQLVSGGGQSGSPGAPLPNPIVLLVTDADGNPAVGVPVFIDAPPGGGVEKIVPDSGILKTRAGAGSLGDGGAATSASLSAGQLACAGDGVIFASDAAHGRIRRVGADGIISTITASIRTPAGLAIGPDGALYVADRDGDRVVAVDPASGAVALFATAEHPEGIAFDAAGDLWIGSGAGTLLRNGSVEIDGLDDPTGVAIDGAGRVLICETGADHVLRFDPATDALEVVADGLSSPMSVAVDALGIVFIADTGNHRIQQVDAVGTVTTIADELPEPTSVCVTPSQDLLIATAGDGRVRRLDGSGVAGSGAVSFAGDGAEADEAMLNAPRDLARDSANRLYVADTANRRLRVIDENGVITTRLGNGTQPIADGLPAAEVGPTTLTRIAVEPDDRVLLVEDGKRIFRLDPVTDFLELVFAAPAGTEIEDVAGSPTGEVWYTISDPANSQTRLERVGGPVALTLPLQGTAALATDAAGIPFVADKSTNSILEVRDQAAPIASTFPTSIEIDRYGHLYIVEGGKAFYVDRATGVLSPVAGTGLSGYSGEGELALQAQISLSAVGGGLADEENGDLNVALDQDDRVVMADFQTEVGDHTIYTDHAGKIRFGLVLPGGFGTVTFGASAVVDGQLVNLEFTATAALPQGTPMPPDPNQNHRRANNRPDLLFPRWWPPTRMLPEEPPEIIIEPPPPPPGGGGGGGTVGGGGAVGGSKGSHQRIAVDASGVVHIVGTPTSQGVTYFNSRPGSRKINGFSSPFVLTFQEGFTLETVQSPGVEFGVGVPAIAVNPINNEVHVAWWERYKNPADPDPAQRDVERIVYRRLSQNPASPGWTDRTIVHFIDPVNDDNVAVGTLSGAHLAVDTAGIANIGFIETTSTGGLDLEDALGNASITARVLLWNGGSGPGQIHSATLNKTVLEAEDDPDIIFGPAGMYLPEHEVSVRRAGNGSIHLAWTERLRADAGADGTPPGQVVTGRVTEEEKVKRVLYLGASSTSPQIAYETQPGQLLTWDFAVGPLNEPHFGFKVHDFVLAGQLAPEETTLLYRRGTGGPLELIVGPSSDTGLTTFRTKLTLGGGHTLAQVEEHPHDPLIAVDSQNIPHLFWTADVTDPGVFGYVGDGLAYATKPVENWDIVEPVLNPFQGVDDFRKMAMLTSVTVGEGDALHLVAGELQIYYSRTYEPNLGAQDPFLAVPAGPGAQADVATGNVYKTCPVFSTDGRGLAVDFSLVYNSLEHRRGPLSRGWSHNYDIALTDHTFQAPFGPEEQPFDLVSVRFGDGSYVVFRRARFDPNAPPPTIPPYLADAEYGEFSTVERLAGTPSEADGSGGGPVLSDQTADFWRMTTKAGARFIFDGDGRLVRIFDTQTTPNRLKLEYGPAGTSLTEPLTGDAERLLLMIVDSVDRETLLDYTSDNRLEKITDPLPAEYVVAYDAAGFPKEVSMPESVKWSFAHYAADDEAPFARRGLLSRIRTPRITDAAGEGWKLDYYADNRFAQVMLPAVLHADDGPGYGESVSATSRVVDYMDVEPDAGDPPSAMVTNTTFHHTLVEYEARRALALEVAEPVVRVGQLPVAMTYDGAGPGTETGHRNLKTIADQKGNVTEYEYFDSGAPGFQHVRDNLKKITLPGAAETIYEPYTSFNLPSAIVDPEGHRVAVTYDDAGNVKTRTAPIMPIFVLAEFSVPGANPFGLVGAVNTVQLESVEKWDYDSFGRETLYTLPNGNFVTYGYVPAAGEPDVGLMTAIQRQEDPVPHEIGYDARGLQVRSKPAGLGETRFILDGLGRIKEIHDPSTTDVSNPKTIHKYDVDSNLVEVTSPKGAVTEFAYDLVGRRTQITDKAFAPHRIKTIRYDRRDSPRKETDFKDQAAFTLYNALDDVIEEIERDEAKTTYTHDGNGNVLTMFEHGFTKPGRLTKFEYDVRDNLTRVTHPDPTLVEEYRYSKDDIEVANAIFKDGLIVAGTATRPNSHHLTECTIHIDPGTSGSPSLLDVAKSWATAPPGASATVPPGIKTCYFYDRNENIRAVQDDLGHVAQILPDNNDRPEAIFDARNKFSRQISYTPFDAIDEVKIVDPATDSAILVRARKNTYTSRGDLKTVVDVFDHVVTFTYDADGNLVKTVDQENNVRELVRNDRGWVTFEKVHVNDGGLGILTTEFQYDANGNVEFKILPEGQIYKSGYDKQDRLESLTTPLQKTWKWVYDKLGQLETETDPEGFLWTYEYTPLGVLDSLVVTKGTQVQTAFSYEYQDGRLLKAVKEIKGGGLFTLQEKYERDSLRRITQQEFLPEAGTTLHATSYTFNSLGWETSKTPGGSVTQFFRHNANGDVAEMKIGPATWVNTYDTGGRLKTTVTSPFPTTRTLTYNARAEIKNDVTTQNGFALSSTTFDYTPAGNVDERVWDHVKLESTFEYLPGVYWLKEETHTPLAGSVVQPAHRTYTYGPNGNRIEQTGSPTHIFTYDADNRLVQEFIEGGQVIGQVELTGTPLVDSTAVGFTAARIADGDTTDSHLAAYAWRSADTAGEHFAGLEFGGPAASFAAHLYIPTLFLDNEAVITGTVTSNATPIALPAIDEPATNDNATIGLTAKGKNPVSGGKLEVKPGDSLTLGAGTYVFDEAAIRGSLVAAGEVRIFIKAKFEAAGKAQVSGGPLMIASAHPADLVLSNEANVAALLLAPQGKLKIQNTAELVGALIGDEVLVQNTAKVTYDAAAQTFCSDFGGECEFLNFAVFGESKVELGNEAIVVGAVYSGGQFEISNTALLDGDLVTTGEAPGDAEQAGIARFKLQARVDGVWTDVVPAAVSGAEPSPMAGWLQTVTPAQHQITLAYNQVLADAMRILQDVGGGSAAKPNIMRIVELDVFASVIAPDVLIDYEYDENGNRTRRVEKHGGQVVGDEVYSYDYADRQVSYVKLDGGGDLDEAFTYLYSPSGLRLNKADALSAESRWFGYAGVNPVADYALSGGSFEQTATYLTGPEPDSILARFKDGQVEHFFWDMGGGPTVVVGDDGTVLNRYARTAFGETIFEEESSPTRIGFANREEDDESGLVHFRARTYDPATGGFLQGDPLSQDAEQYTYAKNNPLSFVDPFGLQASNVRVRQILMRDPQTQKRIEAVAEPVFAFGEAVWRMVEGIGYRVKIEAIRRSHPLGNFHPLVLEHDMAMAQRYYKVYTDATSGGWSGFEAGSLVFGVFLGDLTGVTSIGESVYGYGIQEGELDAHERQVRFFQGAIQLGLTATTISGGAEVAAGAWASRSAAAAAGRGAAAEGAALRAGTAVEGTAQRGVMFPAKVRGGKLYELRPSRGGAGARRWHRVQQRQPPGAKAPVRSPNGMKGGPAHQAEVARVFQDIEARGLRPRTEHRVATVGGERATRVMDVIARDRATGQIVEVHQVGKGFRSNPRIPIARERAALRDVRFSPELRGATRHFHAYNVKVE